MASVFSCTARNFNPISFHWYRHGTEIFNSPNLITILTIGLTSQITLSYTNYIDNSTYYRCQATNNISHVISIAADEKVYADWQVRCE